MRALMLGTLVITFLSGTTTGVLIGNSTAEPAPVLTWIDRDLEVLSRLRPEISTEDLADARKIYEDHDLRVLALRVEAEAFLGDQLRAMEKQTEKKIREIMSRYPDPSSGSK